MVRMFKPQFAEKVRTGQKRQTVRPVPKREIKPGTKISLRMWEGRPYLSRQIILRESVVKEAVPVRITRTTLTIDGKLMIGSSIAIQKEFAIADGFGSWEELIAWFEKTHGKKGDPFPFDGVLIKWEAL